MEDIAVIFESPFKWLPSCSSGAITLFQSHYLRNRLLSPSNKVDRGPGMYVGGEAGKGHRVDKGRVQLERMSAYKPLEFL